MARFIFLLVTICISAAMGRVYLRPGVRQLGISSASADASASSFADGGLGSARSHSSAQSSSSSFGDGLSNSNAQASANAVSQSIRRRPFFDDIIPRRLNRNRLPLRRRGGCECQYDEDCYDFGYCRQRLGGLCGTCVYRQNLW